MIKDPRAWPSYSTELAELISIQERFQDLKIVHVSKTDTEQDLHTLWPKLPKPLSLSDRISILM